MIEAGRAKRVGLLATQGIRGGANRRVLERIKETGDIFLAWSDEPWVLDGADVHISFVGYDDGSETERTLDGQPVAAINANLTAGRRPDAGAAPAREPRASPSWAIRRVDRSTSRPTSRLADARRPQPGRPLESRRRAAVGQRARRHAAAARACGSSTSGPTWPARRRRSTRRRSSTCERTCSRSEADFDGRTTPTDGGFTSETAAGHARGARRACRATSPRRASPSTGSSCGCPCEHARRTASSSSSPATTTTPSACSTRASTSCGHAAWARSCARSSPASATRRPRRFETFPFPRPTDEQREAIAAAARAARSSSATAGSTRPALSDDGARKRDPHQPLQRAARPGSRTSTTASTAAVLAAYGWPADLTDDELLARLLALNLERAGAALEVSPPEPA